MKKVTSKDGTAIAFDQSGKGPAIILVSPALGDHSANAQLAELLAPHFTSFTYDRRGRGNSGDTAPYAVEREVEDIEALINQAGGSVFLYGWSSGAVLALEATSQLPTKIKKLALYEPPFIVDDSRPPLPKDYVKQMTELVAAGRRGDAVEFFMTKSVGVPAEFLAQMRNDPMWAAMEAMAHTLPYDGTIMGDTMAGNPLPTKRWASATMPTLVMDGGESPAWLRHAAQAAADVLLNAQYRTLEGQTHGVAGEALAPVLEEFFITTGTEDREIVATRLLNAPRELMFQMWTDPKHIAQWWGPRGFTTTIHEMDVRPGGIWRLTMHGPDGVDYPNKIVYIEVKKPERLIYHHGEEGQPGYFQATVTFEDQGGKTKLSMQMLFKTAEERDQVIEKYGAVEGLNQTLHKLGEYLAKV